MGGLPPRGAKAVDLGQHFRALIALQLATVEQVTLPWRDAHDVVEQAADLLRSAWLRAHAGRRGLHDPSGGFKPSNVARLFRHLDQESTSRGVLVLKSLFPESLLQLVELHQLHGESASKRIAGRAQWDGDPGPHSLQ
jgi:hypothetical protein